MLTLCSFFAENADILQFCHRAFKRAVLRLPIVSRARTFILLMFRKDEHEKDKPSGCFPITGCNEEPQPQASKGRKIAPSVVNPSNRGRGWVECRRAGRLHVPCHSFKGILPPAFLAEVAASACVPTIPSVLSLTLRPFPQCPTPTTTTMVLMRSLYVKERLTKRRFYKIACCFDYFALILHDKCMICNKQLEIVVKNKQKTIY